jgi:hypothetical protein
MTWCLIKGYGTYFSTGKRYLCRSVINGVWRCSVDSTDWWAQYQGVVNTVPYKAVILLPYGATLSFLFTRIRPARPGFNSQQGLGIFLFTTAFRPVLWPSQPPLQWILGALFPGLMQLGPVADHSPPCSAKVNACSYTSTPPYVFMAWCLVKPRDDFTFTLPRWSFRGGEDSRSSGLWRRVMLW